MSNKVISSAVALQEDDDTPDLARASEIPFNYEMRIESDTLQPVVRTDHFCRWTLQRKGFLSHQSKIQLSLETDDSNDGMYFLPLNIGINSVIRRAVLKCGNRTLCETDEWNRLQGYRSLFLTPENNREREYYLTSRLMSYQPQYSVGQTPSITSTEIGVDTGRNVDDDNFLLLPFAILDKSRPTDNTSTYSIYLGDLFDIFNGNNLPLYMINDDIHIELTMENATNRRMCNDDDADSDGEFELEDDGSVQLIYDTIYFDGDTMEKYRRGKGSDLQFAYVDYRLTRRTGSTAVWSGGVVQNVGGAGRMVDKVIVGLADTDLAALDDGALTLTNRYFAQSPNLTTREISVNVRYNDRDEYTRDLDNLSTLFMETSKAEGVGSEPHVPKALYSAYQGDSITENTVHGRNQREQLVESFCYQGFRLKRGERVNNQGIDIIYTNDITGALDNHTLFVWIALKKIATLKDGVLDCYFI